MLYRACFVAAMAFLLVGCGGQERKTVPAVDGRRLDVAKEILDDADLGYEVVGGGAFGIVVESHWRVCAQHPKAGRQASSVNLIVARSCRGRRPKRGIPDVVGLRLDAAERELDARALEYEVYPEDRVIIRSNWTVCDQYPAPGERAATVELYAEHFSCEWEDDDD